MEKIIDGEKLNVPTHIAVIMDGNGRWAKKRLMPRNFGHKAGADALEQACEDADHLGIKYLTVYAFSTENWKRSVEEVTGIMNLFRRYLINSIDKSNKNNMREAIQNLEESTKNNTGLQFTVAINYGGRDEIRRSMIKIGEMIKRGEISPEDITEDLVSQNLDTYELPDPDLLIRTSGEERTSNFLPWQLAYSEFFFTDTLWPDFDRSTFIDAIRHYSKRDRRYGGVK